MRGVFMKGAKQAGILLLPILGLVTGRSRFVVCVLRLNQIVQHSFSETIGLKLQVIVAFLDLVAKTSAAGLPSGDRCSTLWTFLCWNLHRPRQLEFLSYYQELKHTEPIL